MRQSKIPRKIEKEIYQEANSRCVVCGLDDINVLTVHHIIPYSEKHHHNPHHMCLLCANCHAKADCGEISRQSLYNYKLRLRTRITQFSELKSHQERVLVVGDGNVTSARDIHISGDLNIKIPKAKKPSRPIIIPGTVAENSRIYGYLNYIVRRYNEFKEWECKINNQKMNYALIHVAYKREMKYNIKDTPIDMFDRAVEYLQKRISNTKLGRIRKKSGQKLFSGFETFDQDKKDQ
jgi:hypothetical protein